MHKYHKKNISHSCATFLLFVLVFASVTFCLHWFDTKMAEIGKQISAMESKKRANQAIDQALNDTLEQLQLSANDFYIQDPTAIHSIFVDTMTVNTFCSMLSNKISQQLATLTATDIDIPLGTISGLDFLSHWGPDFSLKLQPKGNVSVDYDTAIEALGINQLHMQIWLNISLEIRIIYPMYQDSIPLSRKIMLLDAVLPGDVPKEYTKVESDGLTIDRMGKMLLNKRVPMSYHTNMIRLHLLQIIQNGGHIL